MEGNIVAFILVVCNLCMQYCEELLIGKGGGQMSETARNVTIAENSLAQFPCNVEETGTMLWLFTRRNESSDSESISQGRYPRFEDKFEMEISSYTGHGLDLKFNVTEEDEGFYICQEKGKNKTHFNLFVERITASPTKTPNTKTGDDCTQRSPSTLIAICCVEGVIIIVIIPFLIFLCAVYKRSRKENTKRNTTIPHDATDKISKVYMDLQVTNEVSSNHANVDVPLENLTLQAPFPGKGVMNYRNAQINLTSKREEIVVKTVSDDAPVRLAKLQADEVRKLSTLTTNENLVQFLGRCNHVPNLLCFEFVNGTNLREYLRENFQPRKRHQYANTKRERYHVPKKGSVENLPRVALQIARGMKHLTAQKFLHPGLRAEKVIIDVSGQCKLYDFVSTDNAKDIMTILWGKSVPYQWLPPEYLFLETLGPSVDVWSFGVLMWEIFSYGALPHNGKGRSDVEKQLRGKETLSLPNNCPGAIWQITLNCWDQSPEKRPLFDHLALQLSFMCNNDKDYDEIESE